VLTNEGTHTHAHISLAQKRGKVCMRFTAI
jgi:hypothetical protein